MMATVQGFDERVLQFFDDHRRAWLDTAANAAMGLGEPASMLLVGGLAVVALVLSRRWRLAAALPLAATGALAAARVGKELVGRDRPPVRLATVYADGSSFPSTAATLTMAVIATVFLLGVLPAAGIAPLRRSARRSIGEPDMPEPPLVGSDGRGRRRSGVLIWGTLACAVPVLVSGWGVMYVGAHWPSDVIAGWALGAVVAVGASVAATVAVTLAERAAPAVSPSLTLAESTDQTAPGGA